MHILARTALFALVLVAPAAALPSVFMDRDEALELAFPDAEIERRTVFLTEEQQRAAEELGGSDIGTPIAYPYVATSGDEVLGYAYFDTHKVRTLKETLMIVVGVDHRIRRVEVLAFAEPQDYVPRASWYEQFRGRVLDDELVLKRGIKNVTGATLTAVATTESARRVLAVHRVLYGTAQGAARR